MQEQLTEIVTLRLTAAEREQLRKLSAAEDRPESYIIRRGLQAELAKGPARMVVRKKRRDGA